MTERNGSILVERLSGDERAVKGFPKIEGDVVRLHIGDPDHPTPNHICEAAIKAMRDGYTHYAPPGGYLELKEGICKRLWEDKRIQKNPDEILVTNGASEGIFLSISTLLNPGDEVLIFDPSYSLYATAAKMLGIVPRFVPFAPGFKITREVIEEHLSNHTRMVILNNPCNPTARVFSKEEVNVIAKLAEGKNFIVLSDEVYHKIIYDGKQHQSMSQMEEIKERSILVDSLSKTYAMTGWRIGYIVAPAKWITWMRMIHGVVNNTLNSIAQKAAITAVSGPQECVELMKKGYESRKILMEKEASNIPGLHPFPIEGTFYLFCRYSFPLKSIEIVQYLLKNGVAVRSGSEFGSQGEGCFRLSFTCDEESLRKGMKRIREAFLKLSDVSKREGMLN
jgi:aspartate aminotransferase